MSKAAYGSAQCICIDMHTENSTTTAGAVTAAAVSLQASSSPPSSSSDACAQIDAQSAASSSSLCASSLRRFAARERGAPPSSLSCFLLFAVSVLACSSSSLPLQNPASLRRASSFSSLRPRRRSEVHKSCCAGPKSLWLMVDHGKLSGNQFS